MTSVTEQISRIASKVNRLIRELHAAERENERLRAELDGYRSRERELTERCRELEEQIAVVKAVRGNLDDAGRKDLEKRLNQYIKEIDRCIALLGK